MRWACGLSRLGMLQGISEYLTLLKLGVGVGLDGRTVTAPAGVVDADGFVDLTAADGKRD